MKRQLFVKFLALVVAGLAATASLAAYPDHPVRVIVPFPPGAGADAVGRLVARELSTALKQPVVVENRPGANGVIGIETALQAPADGYTVLLVDRSVLGVNPSLYRHLKYNPLRDFEYLGIAAWVPYLLVVNPTVLAHTFAELIALEKRDPGRMTYGSFGQGSLPQLAMEALNAGHGTSFRHIPYKGAAPAISAVMAGEIQVTMSSVGSVAGAANDGRVRALVVGGRARSALVRNVPSVQEAGVKPDFVPETYFGFALAKAVPADVAERLAAELRRILQSPEVSGRLRELGMEPGTEGGRDMQEVVRRDIDTFGPLVRRLDIRAD